MGVLFSSKPSPIRPPPHTAKIVSVIRKYHNHKLQTNPRHCEEVQLNNHGKPGRQTKQSNHFSLPHRDDCKTRMDTKERITKHRTITEPQNWSYNQQRVNKNNITTALEWTAARGTRGLKCIYWHHLRPRFCCC